MRRNIQSILMLMALFCLVVGIASAQEITATLTGTVTDSTGAVVPGAKITIHDNARGVDVRTATSDSAGVYTITDLAFGTYTVTIEEAGFQKYVANEVTLHVGDHRALDVALQVGQVTQEVTVTATTVPVETSASSQEGTITGSQVRELQLNTRNFELLLTLQPGVSSTLADSVGFGGIANTSSISVNGARTSANNWMVDGADVNDSGSNLTVLNAPSVDALEEFKLERSTYDAQYGRSGGGQVNVVTKSGTSQFHGDAYEFFRNDVLNATNFFVNSAGGKKPPFRYNDWGFTIGGPVYVPNFYNKDKSKTFFFWSEEWRRTRTPSTTTATLPSATQLGGNFQGIKDSKGNLITLNPASAPAGCITNNVISPACFSQNAQVYIKNVYGNLTPNLPANQLLTSVSAVSDYRQDLIRLDQRVGEKVQLFARYMEDNIPTTEPGGLFSGSPLPGISSTATNSPGRNLVTHATMQLSPSIVNEVAFDYTWGAINSTITGLFNNPAFLNATTAKNFPFSDPYGRIAAVSISGISGVAAPSAPYHERNIDKNIYDNVSIVRGNHTIRTGAGNQWMRKSENGPLNTNGSFSFISTLSPSTNPTKGLPALANFLLGNASTFAQLNHDVVPDIHFINFGAYVQDDWKLKSNLTLNLGLRYDFMATPHDINGILTNFDPATFSTGSAPAIDPATGRFVAGGSSTPATYLNGIIVGGAGSPYGNRVNPNYSTNFSPRVGFSWDPFKNGKTAVRAGYGMYYDRTLNGIWEQNQFANPPVVASLSLSNASFDNPSSGTPPASILSPRTLHATGSPAFKVPYTQGWNFSVQREILPNTVVEVAYVGAKGTHLLGEYDLNQVPVAARLANPTVDANALRPYVGWRTINTISPEFNSQYHSLQISANRRVAQGLNFGLAYTWSKDLTDNTTDRSSASLDTYNRSLDKGPATFNRPQVLVVNYFYNVPFYKGQQGLAGHVLGGWEISGITSIYSGVPLTITQNNDPFDSINGSGIGIDPSAVSPRPDMIANPNGPKTVAQWFNTGAFADSSGHFGTSGRGVVLAPGRNDWDFALFKNTNITERVSTQLRAEFFNVFNHTSLNGVSTNRDSGTFGRVTSAHDPRIIQIGLKFYF